MTKKKFEFIINLSACALALSVFGLLMCNDIILRKTGKEIPYLMIVLIAILAAFIAGIMIINNIKKRKFGEDTSAQATFDWKQFLISFVIVTSTNLILNEAHYIAKSARRGLTPAEKAVTDIMKIYCLFFILFHAVIFTAEYFSKKKANKTPSAEEQP